MAGRTSRLDDPTFAKLVAELWAAGTNYAEAADQLQCHKDTLRVWFKDPRVQAHARFMLQERIGRISRRIDGEIEQRLQNVDEMDTELILKIRKEYLDRPLKLADGDHSDTGKASNELSEAMDANPDVAEAILGIYAANQAKKADSAGE